MASPRYGKNCLNLAISALLLLILGPLLTRFDLLPFQFGLLAVALATLLALVTTLASLWALRYGSDKKLLLAIVLSAAPLALAISTMSSGFGAPRIHDISTDTEDPPQFTTAPTLPRAAQNSLTYDSKNAPLQMKAYPNLKTLVSDRPPAQAFVDALTVAQHLGWAIYAQDAEQGRIEAVDTTTLFGFKDDIVIRIRADERSGSVIDLRSVSRVGEGDLGANAKRIERFIKTFQASL